jgi:monofunctional biosynthetic peptidoglycan transglycosylase
MRRRRKKEPFFKRILRRMGFLFLLLLLLGCLPVLLLRWINPPVTAFMLQNDPANSQNAHYHYQWMDWRELGSKAPLAVMAAEDQKFPDHRGFDVASIHKAVIQRRNNETLRGASTITQQVAKNLFLWPGRSFLRKAIEAYFAVIIELSWPKQRILEVYLNIAEFGPGIYGVPAASRLYFNKTPRQLTEADAALLAAVLPNPKQLQVDKPSAYVRERQRWIMQHAGRLKQYGWLARVAEN